MEIDKKNENVKVFCISGPAQHGKDTFAGFLEEAIGKKGKRVLVYHNADFLKFMCQKYFGWDGKKDQKGRTMLQLVGTEGVRSKEPDYWVKPVLDLLRFFPGQWDYVVIPDCRFPNEVQCLRNAGYDVVHVRITRPNFDNGLTEAQMNHKSETALNGFPVDAPIENSGTLEDLREKANLLLGV